MGKQIKILDLAATSSSFPASSRIRISSKTTLAERHLSHKKAGILIADNEQIVQNTLGKFLDGLGYNTLAASNGKEALNIIDANEVRLAFIAVRMPGFMDGMETLRRIKRRNKGIEVIIMTAYGTQRLRRESFKLGAYAYFDKPFDLADIKRNVETALKKTDAGRV